MKLQFLGATGEVTGSCFLVEAAGRRVLVDCGLIQGGEEDEARNREPFPFDPHKIDAVILTHAHLDHSGRLPLLVKQGYGGPIHTQHASRDLCAIMLRDAAYLNEKEVEWDNRKRQRKHQPLIEPLYTLSDAERAMQRFDTQDYGEKREILPGFELCLQDAGHILGSAIVELRVREGEDVRKLVFSGDLGHAGAPILRDPAVVREADLVIMETTYGDRRHRSWEATWQELADIISGSRAGRGNILIPAFSVGRTQELLYIFKKHAQEWGLDSWQIFLDSPMAIEATEVYARHDDLYDREATSVANRHGSPFMLPNLRMTRRADDSMAINRIHDGAIIIAGSGMCDGGRIKHHLKHNIWRRECQLIIVGFQARGTLGRRLVDGASEISLWGERVRVAATVHTVGGLSAHADCEGLSRWYGQFDGRPPVALIHGEPDARDAMAARLKQEGAGTVISPALGESVDLRKL